MCTLYTLNLNSRIHVLLCDRSATARHLKSDAQFFVVVTTCASDDVWEVYFVFILLKLRSKEKKEKDGETEKVTIDHDAMCQ